MTNPLPNLQKQEPYDFIRRLMSRLRTQDTEEFQLLKQNMKKRIVYDSQIAGFAAMGTRQATNHLNLIFVLPTPRRQIHHKDEIYMQWTSWTDLPCFFSSTKTDVNLVLFPRGPRMRRDCIKFWKRTMSSRVGPDNIVLVPVSIVVPRRTSSGEMCEQRQNRWESSQSKFSCPM